MVLLRILLELSVEFVGKLTVELLEETLEIARRTHTEITGGTPKGFPGRTHRGSSSGTRRGVLARSS